MANLEQAAIGERIGWSRDVVRRYAELLECIGPDILDFAREHQTGRGPSDGPHGPFDFTEGWFRTSGLYALKARLSTDGPAAHPATAPRTAPRSAPGRVVPQGSSFPSRHDPLFAGVLPP